MLPIAPSVLDAVTVYSRGAVCTRRAKVAIESSARQVRVTGLPLSLQAGSLRARVEGGAREVLDVRPGFDVELAPEADVPAEQKAVEASTARVHQVQHELQRLEREIQELQKLKPAFPSPRAGEPPRAAPVAALLQAAEFVDVELAKRFERRRAERQTLEDAQNELELHTKRLSEASSAMRAQRARLTRVAVVTLSDGPAGEVDVAVEYFVPGARWAPAYALRLEKGLAAGALEIRASVAQSTGEDWSQVKLSLSTAALDRRTALPELKSLRIGRTQATPAPSGWREPPPGLEELFEGFDATFVVEKPRPPPRSMPPQGAAVAVAAPASKAARRSATGEIAVARAGPPLPPPSMAPPAPMAVGRAASTAAPMMKRRVTALGGAPGGFGGGGAGEDLEDGAPMEEAEAMASLDEAGASEAMEPPAPALEPALNLLDYGNLFMPAAAYGRGRLRPAPDATVAFFAQMSVQVDVLVGLIATYERRASEVEGLRLPGRAVAPSGGSFDYRYDCAARVDVPSTGRWATISVAQADVGLKAEYACVPSVEAKVYRTVRIANRSKHALLRGPVDVTLGDEFLLTADLPLIPPGSTDARLGLGVEESIKVARKTHYKETTGGLLGGSTVLPHDVEIELNNRLAQSALIEVRERLPFSTDDSVKIEEARVDPPWEKDEAPREGVVVRGARAWHVTVPAGEKKTLTAQFVVRIPSDKMLVGGNRRA